MPLIFFDPSIIGNAGGNSLALFSFSLFFMAVGCIFGWGSWIIFKYIYIFSSAERRAKYKEGLVNDPTEPYSLEEILKKLNK